MTTPLRSALVAASVGLTMAASIAAARTPAFAADAATGSVTHIASAGWVETVKGISDNVAIQAVRAPGQPSTLYMLVSENHCDTATNRMTEISYISPAVAISGSLRIVPGDNAATLRTPIALTGTKTTFTGCSAPIGPITTVTLPPVIAHIDAAWVATGPGAIGGGGISRPATAGGFLAGSGDLASVPLAPTVAALTAVTS